MKESLRTVQEIFTMVRRGEWGGQMIQMDQSKAFDRVHRPYLWATMEKKGVPSAFTDWLKILYEQANVTPLINGYAGTPIRHQQGLRQGCPLSPLLYVLALDPLLEKVTNEPKLEGVPFPVTEQEGEAKEKIIYVAHADDATFFLNNQREMAVVKEAMEEYARASGAAINLQKSQVLQLPKGSREPMSKGSWTEERPQRRTQDEEQQGVEHVRLLGIYFSLQDGEWKHSWRQWKERVLYQLTRWKKWKLSMYQRVSYINTYCLPTATFLASVYPPPKELLESVIGEMFAFLWGTKFFPIARAEAYRQVDQGGLGLRALAPWLMAHFLATNFRGWWNVISASQTEERDQRVTRRTRAIWEAFGNTWATTRWAQKWWMEEGEVKRFHLMADMREELPEYLAEAARWLQELRIDANRCRQKEEVPAEGSAQSMTEKVTEERRVRRDIYEQVVSNLVEQAKIHRQTKSTTISAYRLTDEAACEVFADQTIPFSLWEIRWRAFHQVIRVGATQPWLGREQKVCKRPECRQRAGGPPEETVAHYVKNCPGAKRLWQAVATRLQWKELVQQEWETIVSGLQPKETTQHPGVALARRNRPYGPVPWSIVRLTNLYVIMALGLYKQKELKLEGNRQSPAAPWAEFVYQRLRNCAIWEKEHRKERDAGRRRWLRRWQWMEGFPTPIT